MAKRSIVPFGPQHPVLPEPIHLDLVLEDEVVVEAVPSIGFVHRGLEKLVETKDFKEYVYIAERVCGICSFGHGLGYCQTLEQIMNLEVPPRARYLRTIWMEMSRVHSHLLWLGLLADAMGFESLFMESWKLREKILDMFDATTGGRVIFSVNCIGGVLKDMDETMLRNIVDTCNEMEKELKPHRGRLPAGLHRRLPPAGPGGADPRAGHPHGGGGTHAAGQRHRLRRPQAGVRRLR